MQVVIQVVSAPERNEYESYSSFTGSSTCDRVFFSNYHVASKWSHINEGTQLVWARNRNYETCFGMEETTGDKYHTRLATALHPHHANKGRRGISTRSCTVKEAILVVRHEIALGQIVRVQTPHLTVRATSCLTQNRRCTVPALSEKLMTESAKVVACGYQKHYGKVDTVRKHGKKQRSRRLRRIDGQEVTYMIFPVLGRRLKRPYKYLPQRLTRRRQTNGTKTSSYSRKPTRSRLSRVKTARYFPRLDFIRHICASVICVFETDAVSNLISANVLDKSWLDNFRQADMPEMQIASTKNQFVSRAIIFHLRMGKTRTTVTFNVVDSLLVSVVLETTFIDMFIKSSNPAKRELVAHHFPQVPTLIVRETKKEAENYALDTRDFTDQEQTLLVTLISGDRKYLTVADK